MWKSEFQNSMGNGMNTLICDDNVNALAKLERESVDLVYADPPFFSHKHYEVIWGDEAEVRSFEDRWEGGIEHYIGWMRPRIQLIWEVLKSTGSFFLHCDWHADAHLRLLLDEVFGKDNFRNEIIWHYKFRMMDSGRIFNRKHDVIFFYAKSPEACLDMGAVAERWTREEIIRVRKQAIYKDAKGREWIWMPGGRGHSKNKKKYLEEIIAEGKALDDVWDIPVISSSAKERMGYPTQKPELLLQRIVKACSKPGALVLDPFCGCGTAMVVAEKLGRKWIGVDISPTAVETVKRRFGLLQVREGIDYAVTGMPTTIEDLKKLKPFEFQNWVVNEMQGKHSRKKVHDMGIDGFLDKDLYHEKAGIQVKQEEHVGRNKVDNFETALRRGKYADGYIVAFSFTKDAHEEAARVENQDKMKIRLVPVEDLLKKKVLKG